MNRSYMTQDEADAVDRLNPGNEMFGLGTRLRVALGMSAPDSKGGHVWYVDGTNGNDSHDGLSYGTAFASIGQAIASAGAGDIIIIAQKLMAAGATDPVSYAENVIIPATLPNLSLIGYGPRTQGGLPQISKGSGSAALITVRAPGCLIAGLGINGAGSTGGGILLDDDGSTKSAFGTTIVGCHFKNCKGGTATDGSTGGAIQWSSSGGAWQVRIKGNRFYKNVADIVLLGTGGSVPQDVVIEDNVFGDADGGESDISLYLAGGSGMIGLVIRDNVWGAIPALSGGAIGRYMNLAGCKGIMARNVFGCTGLTFKNASMGTGALVPATVFLAGNYQQVAAGAGATGEIGYTA